LKGAREVAELVGCIAMSHGPQLMINPDHWDVLRTRPGNTLPVRPELSAETLEQKWDKWNRCMAAIGQLRDKLEAWRPDAVIVVSDDQHENLVEDAMPPFAIYVGERAEASISLSYYKEPKSENRTAYAVDHALARHLIDRLLDADFDPAYIERLRYEGGLGHGFARVFKWLTPRADVPIVPIMVNTYYPPGPSPRRCVAFGRALGAAVRAMPGSQRVVIVGSGGLSHTVVDEALDAGVLRAVQANDLDFLAALPNFPPREGTTEILNWIVAAGCADQPATLLDYVPCYRTDKGVGCAMGFAYWDLEGKRGRI
jgi:aromatic ring-opening dioxygenase catalytic subunit (LigB family)